MSIILRYACGIELVDTLVVTGGWVSMATGYLGRVQEYDINGSVRRLPNLRTARRSHACGLFLNSSNRKVREAFQSMEELEEGGQ